MLRIKGPRNAFPLATTGHLNTGARRFHFVAGGIGITPILPMLAVATELGLPWTMTYTGRSRESIPFRDELARYGDRITIRTDDEDGLPTPADLLPPLHPDLAVYCCGPTPMLNVVRDAVAECDGAELHFERFSAPPIENGVPFQVQLGTGAPCWRSVPIRAPWQRSSPAGPVHRTRVGRASAARARSRCSRAAPITATAF